MVHEMTISVSQVEDYPRVLSFPTGVPSESHHMKISAHSKGGRKRKHIIDGQLHGVHYTGCDYGSHATNNDLSCFAVGIMDEKKKKIELIPVHHTYVMTAVNEHSILDAQSSDLTNYERKQSLTEAFGSKKKKRAMRAMESNTISAENITGAEAINHVVANMSKTQSPSAGGTQDDDSSTIINAAQQAIEMQRRQMLPMYETTATSLSEAYPIQGLVPSGVYHGLKEWVEGVVAELSGEGEPVLSSLAGDWEDKLAKEGAPQMVLSLVAQTFAQHSSKPAELKRKLCHLLLYTCLLRFCASMIDRRRPMDKDELAKELMNPPPQVLRHITDAFAVHKKTNGKSAFVGTKALADKVLMHTMVLGLHLSDSNLDISRLSEDLKITTPRLNTIAREIGCAVNKRSDASFSGGTAYDAHIVLPLKFPEGRKKKGGGRK